MALTSTQIIDRVCAIAKAPGFRTQAGQYLNSVLDNLCQTHDFDYIRQTTIISADSSSASYDLPSDYLRGREVFYSVNGTIFWCDQMDFADYDRLFQGPGISNYPTNYATDVGTTPYTIYFYPPPAVPIDVTVRYQPRRDDITTPESSSDVPWFLDQRYLITKTAADLMQETDDARAERYLQRAEGMLKALLLMDDDNEGYARSVKLDPLKFRGGSSLKATKQQPL